MTVKIFVGRLAEGTTRDDVLPLFKKFGSVKECDILNTYGFVHMESEEEAQVAIAALDGYGVKGSHIHVELSTASTQGRKKKIDQRQTNVRQVPGAPSGHGGRFEPYHSRHGPTAPPTPSNFGQMVPVHPPERHPAPSQGSAGSKEEYASEQVKDLLELYFRDPYAFDQYAKTYYYGERLERLSATRNYDRRSSQEGAYIGMPYRR